MRCGVIGNEAAANRIGNQKTLGNTPILLTWWKVPKGPKRRRHRMDHRFRGINPGPSVIEDLNGQHMIHWPDGRHYSTSRAISEEFAATRANVWIRAITQCLISRSIVSLMTVLTR